MAATTIYKDLSAAYDLENMKALMGTEDLLGAMLRIHFILEAFLDIWCNKITNCEDFFGLKRFTSFDNKLEISKKLGLPSELAVVFKLFNKLRNKFAHKPNYVICSNDLDNIHQAINQITTHNDDSKFSMIAFNGREIRWDMPDIPTIDSLLLNYFAFSQKVNDVFTNEFSKRNIPFSIQVQQT